MSGADGSVLASCRDAACTYGRGRAAVVAVHGATCDVRAGDRIAVTGPSGSGKSTLLYLLAGLVRPTVGTVTWPAIGPVEALRPGPVGVVFQGPSLLPPLDVIENVALPMLLLGADAGQARERATALLGDLGLEGLARQLPDELSGGQAQRVAIARALVTRPRLVLADEPTGQLDHDSAATVIDILLGATADRGTALVVTTHDPRVADRLVARWTLADGRLVAGRGLPPPGGEPEDQSCSA